MQHTHESVIEDYTTSYIKRFWYFIDFQLFVSIFRVSFSLIAARDLKSNTDDDDDDDDDTNNNNDTLECIYLSPTMNH